LLKEKRKGYSRVDCVASSFVWIAGSDLDDRFVNGNVELILARREIFCTRIRSHIFGIQPLSLLMRESFEKISRRLKLTKHGFAIEEIHFKAEQMIVAREINKFAVV